MTKSTDLSPSLASNSLIGALRRFGPYGPVYEVIGPSETPDEGRLRIRVITTGEEVDYRVSEILNDPRD